MKAMRVAATLLCGACLIVPLSRAPVSGDPPSNWAWAIGGAGTENLSVLEPTSDGGWILGGETLGFGAKNQDIWVVKLGTDGKVQWQKRYGGNANEYIGGPGSVCQAPDGGFLIAATTYTFGAGRSDGWILRIDSFGSVLWQKTLGGPGWEHFFGLDLNADGTWIITGNTELFGGKDVWLVKIDDTGRVLWQRAYKAAGHYTNGWVVRCTHDGSYFVMGEAYRLMADGYFWEDGLCMLVDPSGNLRWQRQITAGDYVDDVVTDAIQVRDGGFVCAGWSTKWEMAALSALGGVSLRRVPIMGWIFKLDSTGNMRWQYAYGQDEWFNSISQTKDGGLLATGGTGAYGNGDGDGWCLRLTANGKVKWQVTYGGSLGDWLLSGRQAADGSFTLAGTTESFSFGKTDYFFIRVPSDGFSCSQITGTSNIRPMKMNTYVLTPTVKSKRLVVSPRTSKCVPVDTRCVITDACLTTRALGVGLR